MAFAFGRSTTESANYYSKQNSTELPNGPSDSVSQLAWVRLDFLLQTCMCLDVCGLLAAACARYRAYSVPPIMYLLGVEFICGVGLLFSPEMDRLLLVPHGIAPAVCGKSQRNRRPSAPMAKSFIREILSLSLQKLPPSSHAVSGT